MDTVTGELTSQDAQIDWLTQKGLISNKVVLLKSSCQSVEIPYVVVQLVFDSVLIGFSLKTDEELLPILAEWIFIFYCVCQAMGVTITYLISA